MNAQDRERAAWQAVRYDEQDLKVSGATYRNPLFRRAWLRIVDAWEVAVDASLEAGNDTNAQLARLNADRILEGLSRAYQPELSPQIESSRSVSALRARIVARNAHEEAGGQAMPHARSRRTRKHLFERRRDLHRFMARADPPDDRPTRQQVLPRGVRIGEVDESADTEHGLPRSRRGGARTYNDETKLSAGVQRVPRKPPRRAPRVADLLEVGGHYEVTWLVYSRRGRVTEQCEAVRVLAVTPKRLILTPLRKTAQAAFIMVHPTDVLAVALLR